MLAVDGLEVLMVRFRSPIPKAAISCRDILCPSTDKLIVGTRDSNLGPNSAKLDHTYYTDGVSYEYSVEWIAGCTTTAANESVYAPTGSVEAEFICLGIWSDCYLKCEYLVLDTTADCGFADSAIQATTAV